MSDASEEPRLIIDEDWKTRVQREKDELLQKEMQAVESKKDESHSDAQAESGPQLGESQDADQSDLDDLPPPPPATLEILFSNLATQAISALGQVPDGDGTPLPIRLDYARHFIDLLGILEEKTKGNLTPQESSLLKDMLHQLRMLFVEFSKRSK